MIKLLSFGLCGVLTLIMMAASIADKMWGNASAIEWFYAAPWTISLWIVTGITSVIYIVRHLTRLNAASVLLHAALVVILCGAAVTHYNGLQGKVSITRGESVSSFIDTDNKSVNFPFSLTLQDCHITTYPGTSTPMDYASEIIVIRNGDQYPTTVSMNNVLSIAGYRFYQSGMGDSYTVLSVSYDPWGIGITYSGYILLFLSMAGFFFFPKSRFRQLIKSLVIIAAIITFPASSLANDNNKNNKDVPPALQKGLSRDFGRMLVFYNGRVCPVQTLARDFCIKLYGKPSYRGLTAEQVLTGWIFYYSQWKNEPMIAIKSTRVRKELGIQDKFASLNDFYSAGKFRLDYSGKIPDRDVMESIEKTALISSVCTGAALKIYPVTDNADRIDWISWVDEFRPDMDLYDQQFLRGSMEFVAREIAHGRNISADEALKRIAARQIEILGKGYGPDTIRYKAEILYNCISRTLAAAIFSIICGLTAFFIFCRATAKGITIGHATTVLFTVLSTLIFIYVSCLIILRGIIGGQLPLGNGYETMLALAWTALLTGLIMTRRFSVMQSAALVIAGMAMMVAMMGEKNPQITHLMPVLQSPLLSIHVMVIMISYSLLAFIALNSVAAFAIGIRSEASTRLAIMSRILLYPATFFLATGIFIGAIWANQSWGRYWGWDPKETWALITLLIYAFPLHSISFKAFNRPRVIHSYLLAALLSVIMTYLGVNLLLPGLHSYA